MSKYCGTVFYHKLHNFIEKVSKTDLINVRSDNMIVISVGYDQMVMTKEDALTMIDILERAQRYERKYWNQIDVASEYWLQAILIPFLAFYLKNANPALIPGLMVGEILTVGGLIIFGVSVGRELLRKSA